MKISKMFKRIASMGMALAMAMSCAAISAGAVDMDPTTVTANLYVDADHSFKGKDSYLTPDSAFFGSLQLPIKGTTQNATLSVEDDTATLVVPVTNNILRFVSFADSKTTAEDTTSSVSAEVTGTSGGYVTEITFTYDVNDVDDGTGYVFDNCNLYAGKSLLTVGYQGAHVLPVTLKIG